MCRYLSALRGNAPGFRFYSLGEGRGVVWARPLVFFPPLHPPPLVGISSVFSFRSACSWRAAGTPCWGGFPVLLQREVVRRGGRLLPGWGRACRGLGGCAQRGAPWLKGWSRAGSCAS